jgi:hypothetical protein
VAGEQPAVSGREGFQGIQVAGVLSMRIKGLVLLAVMIVVTVIYLAGENFGCSGRAKSNGRPAPSSEKK